MQKYLSISIVSWNTEELLRQCLASLYANLGELDTEVIVVDNASSDGSVDMVTREFPQVKLIRNASNCGFARANNIAYEQSSGRYFLLLNSDTIVRPGSLESLAKYMDGNLAVGAVAPRLLNGDGSLQRSCSCFPTPFTEFLSAFSLGKLFWKSPFFARFEMSYWNFDEVREVDFAGGSCLMLRRAALEQVGALDEDYFMYTEEADLCYRLKRGGWKVMFIPHAEIVHLGGQSSRLRPVEMAIELPVSRHRFIKKFYGPLSAALFRGVVAVGGVCRLIVWGCALIVKGRKAELEQGLKVQRGLLKWSVTGGRK